MGQRTTASSTIDQRSEDEIVRSTFTSPAFDSPATSHRDPATAIGLNRGDRRVVTVLIVVALVLMSMHWYRLMHVRPTPIVVLHPDGYRFQLDVNRASWVEWMQLDRIGETLARRIVEDRQRRGPFSSVDDVRRVNGIGPKTMESLRPYLTCAPVSDVGND